MTTSTATTQTAAVRVTHDGTTTTYHDVREVQEYANTWAILDHDGRAIGIHRKGEGVTVSWVAR